MYTSHLTIITIIMWKKPQISNHIYLRLYYDRRSGKYYANSSHPCVFPGEFADTQIFLLMFIVFSSDQVVGQKTCGGK